MIKIGKRSLLFTLVLCILLIFDTLDFALAGIKISAIWKTLLCVILLLYFILKINDPINRIVFVFVFLGVLFSFKLFFHLNIKTDFFYSFRNSIVSMIFPLSFFYFYKKYLYQPQKLEKFLVLMASIITLSSVPFFLGLISPAEVKEDFSFDQLVKGVNINFLIGPFNHPAIAAQVYATAFAVILFSKKVISNNFKHSSLVVIGTINVLACFTRTGWISMFLIYLIFFIYKRGLVSILKLLPLFLTFLISIYILFSSNELFMSRLLGIYSNKTYIGLDTNTFSSGRLYIYDKSIEVFTDLSFSEKLIGIGIKETMSRINGVIPHNFFLETILFGGLGALFIWFLFFIKLMKLVKIDLKTKRWNQLVITLTILYLFFLIPSHGMPFWGTILYSGFLSLGFITNQNKLLQ